jgi:5-methylcytosine-specific restriction enzyme B
MSLAEKIRKYVLEEYIEPARRRGNAMVWVRAGDVHTALGLKNRMPAVCGALDTDIFLNYARVRLVCREGPYQGANAEWVLAVK